MFFKSDEQNYGSWLRDALTLNDASSEKIWLTKENDPYQLYEYANKAAYRSNTLTKTYKLKLPFQVSSHSNISSSVMKSNHLFAGERTYYIQWVFLLHSKR